jgi:hypothetical protein
VHDDIPDGYWDRAKKSDSEEDSTFDPYAQDSDKNAEEEDKTSAPDKPIAKPKVKINPFTG